MILKKKKKKTAEDEKHGFLFVCFVALGGDHTAQQLRKLSMLWRCRGALGDSKYAVRSHANSLMCESSIRYFHKYKIYKNKANKKKEKKEERMRVKKNK